MQVIHTRLRNRCSSLNEHLYSKKLVQSPLCRSGSVESTQHYFLDCLFHRDLRLSLSQSPNVITTFTLNTILFGDENLSLLENQRIFNSVHTYIRNSKRFSSNVCSSCFEILLHFFLFTYCEAILMLAIPSYTISNNHKLCRCLFSLRDVGHAGIYHNL